MTTNARPHGRFLAAEAGELAGVSGTTIGQWARRGLIRSSISDDEPRVYSVEDVAEAAVVRALLARKVRHRIVRLAIRHLGDYGDWVLTARGWQRPATPTAVKDVRLRLKRTA